MCVYVCSAQVIQEHFPFMTEEYLACAFATDRILVDDQPADPAHSLSLGQTWKMIYHLHEIEVKGHSDIES